MCQSATSSHRQQIPHADVRRKGAYATTAEDGTTSDDSEALLTIEAILHQEASIRKVKSIYRVGSRDNIPLTMLVDTGSPFWKKFEGGFQEWGNINKGLGWSPYIVLKDGNDGI
ncbi:hypothetical protein MTO96_012099 [Rhipicephalus appendiculatus]